MLSGPARDIAIKPTHTSSITATPSQPHFNPSNSALHFSLLGSSYALSGDMVDREVPSPLSADALFGASNKKMYLRWQTSQPSIPLHRHGALPTAFEYEDFCTWRAVQRLRHLPPGIPGALFLNLGEILASTGEGEGGKRGWMSARKCGHALHPAHPEVFAISALSDSEDEEGEEEEGEITDPILRCPVCTIRAHLAFVGAILQNWEHLGGPWRLPHDGDDARGIAYAACTRAYHRAKLDMANTVFDLEEWADAERAWEEENVGVDVEAVRPFGARAALMVFREEHSFPARFAVAEKGMVVDSDGAFGSLGNEAGQDNNGPTQSQLTRTELGTFDDNSGSLKQKRRNGRTKTVSFTSDTREPGNRCNAFFYRHSPAYDPSSPYACPSPLGWADTSFQHDPLFTISQSRILLLLSTPNLDPKVSYRDLNTAPDFGDNKHVTRLQRLVTEWLSEMAEGERNAQMVRLVGASELFIVYTEGWEDSEEFEGWCSCESLVGTVVEGYAKMIGEIGGEEDESDGMEAHGEVDTVMPAPVEGTDNADDEGLEIEVVDVVEARPHWLDAGNLE